MAFVLSSLQLLQNAAYYGPNEATNRVLCVSCMCQYQRTFFSRSFCLVKWTSIKRRTMYFAFETRCTAILFPFAFIVQCSCSSHLLRLSCLNTQHPLFVSLYSNDNERKMEETNNEQTRPYSLTGARSLFANNSFICGDNQPQIQFIYSFISQ